MLNNWIAQAERQLGNEARAAGSVGWLVASSVAIAAVQRAVDADGDDEPGMSVAIGEQPAAPLARRHGSTFGFAGQPHSWVSFDAPGRAKARSMAVRSVGVFDRVDRNRHRSHNEVGGTEHPQNTFSREQQL